MNSTCDQAANVSEQLNPLVLFLELNYQLSQNVWVLFTLAKGSVDPVVVLLEVKKRSFFGETRLAPVPLHLESSEVVVDLS
jgi:hypothetical protein